VRKKGETREWKFRPMPVDQYLTADGLEGNRAAAQEKRNLLVKLTPGEGADTNQENGSVLRSRKPKLGKGGKRDH